MVVKTILAEAAKKNAPAAKLLFTGDKSKVLVLGFKEGMILKKHKAPDKAKLLIISGKVEYIAESRTIVLQQHDDLEIPLEEYHTVKALEDSIGLLMIA